MWPGDTRPLWQRALEKRRNWLSAQGKRVRMQGTCDYEGCRRPARVLTADRLLCSTHYIKWLRETA